MSAIVTGILIDIATKVGAPFVKGILREHLPGLAGDLGGEVIDAIAKRAGVTPEQLPDVPAPELERAVAIVENAAPALVLAYAERQRLSNELQLAEMNKESAFGWMWRPAGMWLMLACIGWYVILVPLVNALLSAAGARGLIAPGVDFAAFTGVFVTYIGLYMGGHTAKQIFSKGDK